MSPLSLLFGAAVGLSLGLTGGGGAIFAVPLLVYGLAVPAREAVSISLAAVGATSCFGFLARWMVGEVEVRTGLLFAAAGILGAPWGAWVGSCLPDSVLLLLFAGIMLVVAMRMWQQASRWSAGSQPCAENDAAEGPACRRDAAGVLLLNSRCAGLLLVVGALTGILSGLFGVGGGFVIVPALVLFSGMSIHRAVGTSLLVITLVSASGVISQLWAGRTIPPVVTFLFILGGVAGLIVGQQLARLLSGPALQKVFAAAIIGVAAYVTARNLSFPV